MKKLVLAAVIIMGCLTLVFGGCQSCRSCNDERNKPEFSVEFIVDGEMFLTSYYYLNSKIEEPDMNERDNYAFKGWFISDAYAEKWDFANDVLLGDMKLYGTWVKADEDFHRVLFYNGETLITSQKVKAGDCAEPQVLNPRNGYNFDGWFLDGENYDFGLPVARDLKLYARWTAVTYTVRFVADGQIIGESEYTVENKNVTIPKPPEKEHYIASWKQFDLTYGDLVIEAVYTPVIYTATFKADGNIYKQIKYTVEDSIALPSVPDKQGYTGKWPQLPAFGDFTIIAEYTPIEYKINFVIGGVLLKTVTYTVEDELLLPEITERAGYTGSWEEFEEFSKQELTVNAVYTLIRYKAVFIADGEVVATEYFTVENMRIKEPEVPPKNGFTAKWREYELGLRDIEVTAVYTPQQTERR